MEFLPNKPPPEPILRNPRLPDEVGKKTDAVTVPTLTTYATNLLNPTSTKLMSPDYLTTPELTLTTNKVTFIDIITTITTTSEHLQPVKPGNTPETTLDHSQQPPKTFTTPHLHPKNMDNNELSNNSTKIKFEHPEPSESAISLPNQKFQRASNIQIIRINRVWYVTICSRKASSTKPATSHPKTTFHEALSNKPGRHDGMPFLYSNDEAGFWFHAYFALAFQLASLTNGQVPKSFHKHDLLHCKEKTSKVIVEVVKPHDKDPQPTLQPFERKQVLTLL
eukprot:jgi/Psemu1/28190/gm1.28190_g